MFNFFLLLCLYLPFQVALNPILGIDLASIRILILVLFIFWFFIGAKNKKRLFSQFFPINSKISQNYVLMCTLKFEKLEISVIILKKCKNKAYYPTNWTILLNLGSFSICVH